MATEPVRYFTFAEAVTLHMMLMRRLCETSFGVFDRALVESALGRPRNAADLEGGSTQKAPTERLLCRAIEFELLGGTGPHPVGPISTAVVGLATLAFAPRP